MDHLSRENPTGEKRKKMGSFYISLNKKKRKRVISSALPGKKLS